MFESKYSKVLTVILVIVIIAIIGLLGFLGYQYYQNYVLTNDAAKEVDNFNGDVGANDENSQIKTKVMQTEQIHLIKFKVEKHQQMVLLKKHTKVLEC